MAKVSVITTLYNYKKYIAECISSVLHQDYKNLEMIIVDDMSTDNGCEIVKTFINKYANIRLIRLNNNYGYSTAKNVGIAAASGEVICMLDADDMLLPGSISSRMAKMNEGFDFVHGWAYNFDKRGRRENEMRKKWINNPEDRLRWKYIHPQGVLLKKSVHEIVGLYDEELKCKSDREMWARIFYRKIPIAFIDSPVSLYRQHMSQMHKSMWKKENNKRLASELFSLVEIRKQDISDCEILSKYKIEDKIMDGKQKLTNEEAHPLALHSPQDLYEEDFFAKRVGKKHDWGFAMGKYASMKLGISSMIDIGCGIGSFLSGAKAHGLLNLCGVEIGYEAAKPHLVSDVAEFIKFGNAAVVSDFGRYDASVSIEVAEHLPKEQADAFCKNLAQSASRMIVMTAAGPGQEGVHHFNCRPRQYWIEKIESLGFKYREDLSRKISEGWARNVPNIPRYLTKNVIVFKRAIDDISEEKKKISIASNLEIIVKPTAKNTSNLRVSFDLKDNDSSGKHKFFQRVRESLRQRGYHMVKPGEKSDIHFYINYRNKNSKVNIKRLDGVYFDGTAFTRNRNSHILSSMRTADGIIYQSEYCKNMGCQVLGFTSSKPSRVILNGCDPTEFNVEPKILDRPYFLALCKWRRHKRLQESVEGFIRSEIKDHYLVVAGPPDYTVDHPQIKYIGDLNRMDLSRYIKGCIGTVHLAWIDWCPNSVVESIMAGKQVIHTNSGGTQEIVNGRGYQVKDKIWIGEKASPKSPPEISLDDIADAYIKSIKSPIVNFNKDDLSIEVSAKMYIDFGISILERKK